MFRLHTSNDAATLAATLGKWLCGPRDNPLVPARVLVPQVGLRRWLQVTLAERHGVIANVDFTPPAQFAWELLRAASPELPRRSPFEVDVLRWHLYQLLGEGLDGAALAPLREYLHADGDPLRRYALSFELARVFERMQGYRRDQLRAWERGGSHPEGEFTGWQAEVWRRLLLRVGDLSRAARVEAWLRAYDPEYPAGGRAEKPPPPGLPIHLSCFACANVSPDVLRMLAVASLHCNVDFFLPLPSKEYLGDTPRSRRQARNLLAEKDHGNPLVVSLGGAAAEFLELLYGYEHVQPADETEAFDTAIARTSLLGRVRDDILKHAAPRADDRQLLPDDSLQFRACHTPLREIETLHDALLAMLENPRFDPPLQPREIAVMLPDVAIYQSAIQAVFGDTPRSDTRCIPYNLGDTGAGTLHSVTQLFLDLLDAPASRWQASEILDVLAAPGVMRRFDLDADALERLSRHVRAAGVRWGEDERARADCGGYREFSWAFGIDRIVAGFACGDEVDALIGGTAPLPGVEGAAFAHLDAVLAVTATWRRLRDLSQHAHPARQWQQVLNEIIDSLYQSDPSDLAESRALERVRGALEKFADDCAHAGAEFELPWAAARTFLRDQLARADPQQHLFTGGVTFCGMVPLRVVPFRVICLLGMDEAAFPRRETSGLDPLLRDRREGHPVRGDRDVRTDDRLLFLQLLAAAREGFYVSWIGRDPHSNEPRPPSVVVAELLDNVREHYLAPAADEEARRQRDSLLPRIEPLHPFATTLFDTDAARARSFHAEWLPAARAPARSASGLPLFVPRALPAPAAPTGEIQLDELKRFFDDPARGFLACALQIVLPREEAADADLEPLRPDEPWLRYQLTTTLLARGDADAEREKLLLRAQGALPPGALADAALAIARERADALRTEIDAFTGAAAPRDDLTATLELEDGTRLAGTVDNLYSAGLVRATPGKLNGRRVLAAWIDALFAAAASNTPVACRLFWIDGENTKYRDFAPLETATARVKLAELVAAMRAGLRTPLPLFPQASWEALKRARARQGEADCAEFMGNLGNTADADGRFAHGSDFERPTVRMAWRGLDLTATSERGAQALYDMAASLLPVLQAGKAKR